MQHGRISAQQRDAYRLLFHGIEFDARVSGRFRHATRSGIDFPVVGDDVLFERTDGPAIIHDVLPRRGIIVRKTAGAAADPQAIAANVDVLFIVSGLDGDFNIRRIERYTALAANSNARPVLLLNKLDLCSDINEKLFAIENSRGDVPIHLLSALTGEGFDTLQCYLEPERIIALVGSSGAGKSTITNRFLEGNVQRTGSVRQEDDRGRHTTTARELFVLTSGAMLIDTPGMRELHLWAEGDGLSETFDDIEQLALGCKFTDCRHDCEPGCAVQAALEMTLDRSRFENYLKLRREQAYLERKVDARAAAEEQQRWKTLHRQAQEHMRFKRRRR